MKATFTSWCDVEIDMSDEDKEVSDYVLDQIDDRLDEVAEVEIETEKDYEKKKLSITSTVVELVQRIIEEKQADMNYERRASKELDDLSEDVMNSKFEP